MITKILDIIINIQKIFEEGFIQKEFIFSGDVMDFMFVRIYFPKIFLGFYSNEFEEKYFKFGMEAETALSFHKSIKEYDDHIHIVFNCMILGFGFGIFRQRGY